MEDKIKNLLLYCSKIDFDAVNLSDGKKEFCSELNSEIIALCKSLPESTQIDALLFLMKYSRTSLEELNFFKMFYVPAWSIIYWLMQSVSDDKELEKIDIKNTKAAHTMAMFLHSLDDHLNDSEISVTHLVLLLRSQSWMIMTNAFKSLSDEVDGGNKIVQDFLDDYYSSICGSNKIESLDMYCNLFRKQMATWLIAPVLMLKKIVTNEDVIDAIQTAYGSFGIAWRLLDDINDIETDMMKGVHSSIYICLPENIKNHWDKDTEDKNSSYAKVILDHVLENSVIDKIKERICSELESAASIADNYDLIGMGDEFRCLLKPLKNRQNNL